MDNITDSIIQPPKANNFTRLDKVIRKAFCPHHHFVIPLYQGRNLNCNKSKYRNGCPNLAISHLCPGGLGQAPTSLHCPVFTGLNILA